MLKTFVTLLALVVLAVATAAAQTATHTSTTTGTSTSTTNSNQGAYDKLSPGNQKIVDALFNAQPQPTTTPSSGSTTGTPTGSTSTTSTTFLSKDDIAAMHLSGKGWGVIFKQMKANGQIPSDVKNLGQLVSGRYQTQSGSTSGTTITTASGKAQVVGSSATSAKSGKGHLDDASAGAQGPGGASSGATASGANAGGHGLGHAR